MKKVTAIFASVLLMVSLALPALAESGRVIQVSGSGVVSLAADTASIQIGVETRSDNVKDAQQEGTGDLLAEEGEGQHADKVGHARHDQQIGIELHINLHSFSVVLPISPAKLPRRFAAKAQTTCVKNLFFTLRLPRPDGL